MIEASNRVQRYNLTYKDSSSSSVFACFRSAVSNPSVNQPYTGARRSWASVALPWLCQRLASGAGSIRDRNPLIFRCGRAIVSHQHRKIRRIRFVTPTKLSYPWNLMS